MESRPEPAVAAPADAPAGPVVDGIAFGPQEHRDYGTSIAFAPGHVLKVEEIRWRHKLNDMATEIRILRRLNAMGCRSVPVSSAREPGAAAATSSPAAPRTSPGAARPTCCWPSWS